MRPAFKICVTCVGGILIYDFIKALRDAADYDVHVFGIDSDLVAHGRLLCDSFDVVPRADRDPAGWLVRMSELIKVNGIDGVICLSDKEAKIAAENHALWRDLGVEMSVGPKRTAEIMTDKLHLLTTLAEGGLDTGGFLAVNSGAEAKSAVEQLGYPGTQVVLKPRRESGSRGVLVCDAGRDSFVRFLDNRLCGAGRLEHVIDVAQANSMTFEDCIAVPYWDGPVFDVECLVQRGVVIQTVARRRQLRNIYSPTSTGHIVDMNPDVVRYAHRMCEILGVERAADFDIVLRPDGKPTPFDASPRFSGSVGGGYYAGVNIISQLVRVMFGLPLAAFSIRNGVPLRPFRTLTAIPEANSEILL